MEESILPPHLIEREHDDPQLASRQLRLALHTQRNEIRLLKLLPGSWDVTISCETFVVSLDDSPAYEAISYVWGPPINDNLIFVDGWGIYVRANLECALRYLRQPVESRILWVDALCIEQANHIEKSAQVNMMGTIFKSCTQAVLWLGKENEPEDRPGIAGFNSQCIELAFRILPLLGDNHLKHLQESGYPKEGITVDDVRHAFHGLQVISNRPWWRRIWTVQEVLLPEQALFKCGRFEMSRERFEDAALRCKTHRYQCCRDAYLSGWEVTRAEGFVKLLNSMAGISFYRNSEPRTKFVEIYSEYALRQATDPRDKIFALYGMMESSAVPMPVNYDLSPQDICKGVTEALLESTRLQIFCFKRQSLYSNELPSWVIDLVSPMRTNEHLIMQHWRRCSKKYKASLGSTPKFDITANTISMNGIFFDVVVNIHPELVVDNTRSLSRSGLRAWMEYAKRLPNQCPSYLDDESRNEAFFRTIIGDIVRDPKLMHRFDKAPSKDRDEMRDSWNLLKSYSASEVPPRGLPRDHERLLISWLYRRRLFITGKGYYGIASEMVKLGDLVTIVFGGSIPFIFRRENSALGDGEYPETPALCTLVSHCYVHGIMDGEALAEAATSVPTRIDLQ
jgi:hypothetical protein